ncbi:hypothetical protein [uncultured Dokdonia sp.]|uniref:hypothetical protein n=1 Tax=uncultured Dokdonia sp. TaxID=575653 RepID=UPI002638902F|nr:hypothetical protein [uncultured Dokdonia sp.]
MSIFEFADQLGFNPPIVFEDNAVSEEGVYNDVIDFDKLAKTIGKYRSFEFDYSEYISNKTTTLTINALDGTEPQSYEIHIPLIVNDPEKGERTLQLSGVLNKKKGKVNRNEGSALFSFKLDASKRIISYIKKIKYETSNEIAIRIETPIYEDYISLSEIVKTRRNKEVDALIIREFNDAFRNVSDDATLKWLYEKAPLFVLKQRGNETLIKDLKTLLTYDLEGALSWFKDSGTAIMKLLFGFTDPKVLYDYFNTKPEEAIRIYDALQGTAEVQFTTLLTTLAQLYTREVKNDETIQEASRRDVTFNIGKGYRLNSDILIKDDQKNIKLERFGPREFEFDIQLNNTEGETVDIPLKVPINALLDGPTIFHPLDLVILKDANGNGEVPVCALEVKYLSDEAEWETVINTTLIIVNIVGILVSAGALSAGATGFTAVIAAADIVISTIDIAVILRRPELKGTQEGAWLDRNWEAISGSFAIVSVSSAVRQGLIKNGPGIVGKLSKVKDASAIVIRERIQRLLFQAIINVEISNFGNVAFKIVPINQVRSVLKTKIVQSNIDRLWRLGVSVLEGQVDGKAIYGLMHQGEVILSGATKEIDNFLKTKIFTHGAKDAEILKILDNIAERVRNVGFHHIPTSGVIINSQTKKGSYLVGSFASDLQFILKQLDYPEINKIDDLFPLLDGQRFNLLNVSDDLYEFFVETGGFFKQVNAKWVDSAVAKKVDVVIMSDFKALRNPIFRDGIIVGEKLSGFGKEIHRFEWKHGYRFDPKTKMMVPPEKAKGLPSITEFKENKL